MKILSHEELVKNFKGGFVYSLKDKTLFDLGVDKYILPSVNKDLQMRTSKIKGNGIDSTVMKSKLSNLIKTEFWDYINNQNNFANFRDHACENVIAILKERYQHVSYGKAQKFVNMTFKYLYCFDGAIQLNQRFTDCHMPLDSKILNWYRANIDKNQKTCWSCLTKNEYLEIQQNIKQHIKAKYVPYSVLQAEFVIWDNEINKK